jgi:Alginate lyase
VILIVILVIPEYVSSTNYVKTEAKTLEIDLPSSSLTAPRTFFLDSSLLAHAKKVFRSNEGNGLLIQEITKLIQQANLYLKARAPSVMDKTQVPPSNTKHDYLSLPPYRWPNPNTSNGLPYVFRDGKTNPEVNLIHDNANLNEMIIMTKVLSLAYFFTEDSKYAEKAEELIRVWFLRENTRMNPNLEYSEIILGKTDANPSGIIAGGYLPNLFDAIPIIEKSPTWTKEDREGIERWFGQYLDWLLNSKGASNESMKMNNHGTYYELQISSIALFLNKTDLVKKILHKTMQEPSMSTFSDIPKLISSKILPDGSQPFELSRTKPLIYSMFNLLGLFKIASIGEHVGINLWNYETAEGGGLQKALDFLIPYGLGDKVWPYEQLKPIRTEYLADLLCQASIKYNSDVNHQSYISYYESINPIEIPRNLDNYGICLAAG